MQKLGRRHILLKAFPAIFAGLTVPLPSHARFSNTSITLAKETETLEDECSALTSRQDLDFIYRFKSGVQFRDVRVGNGPLVTELLNKFNYEESPYKNRPVVVMHIQAYLRDGSVLLDTREDGKPILYELGSSLDAFSFPRGSSPNGYATKTIAVTPGIDDVIVSRGRLRDLAGETTNNCDVPIEAMREGGVRRVFVPADLAYGNRGVSRYEILMTGMTLKKPVPRDEPLRYEIEILRCQDVPIEVAKKPEKVGQDNDPRTPLTAELCCSETVFPCSTKENL